MNPPLAGPFEGHARRSAGEIMTDKTENDGAWIFVSHSHKDLKEVREIRNELERRGHKPIMFYLKCLEDDDADLPDLLRREIEARTWFILCDSPNSRASRWVQREKEIVKSLKGKVYREVDIAEGLGPDLDKVVEIAKRATVFLSYARTDAHQARQIAAALRAGLSGCRLDARYRQLCGCHRSGDRRSRLQRLRLGSP